MIIYADEKYQDEEALIKKDSRIFIAGHNGLVGNAILRLLRKEGFNNLIVADKETLDLRDQSKTRLFFRNKNLEYVILAAARVGGILANNKKRAQFLHDNLNIQNNVIYNSHVFGVKKLLFFGSSCIYPRLAKQPLKEESLLTGPLEQTNEGYAIAKIAGLKLCQYYYKQYGDNFVSIMPTNLYGPNDNFDANTSHVIPALISKFHNAKIQSFKEVKIWGTGKALREFLYVDDLAEAVLFVLININAKRINDMGLSHLNIGSSEEISIMNLTFLIKDIVGYDGRITFDTTMPDGTPRKLLDCTILESMGWKSKVSLSSGIKELYNWYKTRFQF